MNELEESQLLKKALCYLYGLENARLISVDCRNDSNDGGYFHTYQQKYTLVGTCAGGSIEVAIWLRGRGHGPPDPGEPPGGVL